MEIPSEATWLVGQAGIDDWVINNGTLFGWREDRIKK